MENQAFWQRRVARTVWRHNLGQGLSAFLPLCLAVSLVFACALLILRRNGSMTPAAWIWYGAGLLGCLLAAGQSARKRFFTAADARVRLEAHLGLHNRLTAATAGIGAFPPVQPAPDGYAFRWERIVTPLAGAAAFVWAAALLPIGKPPPVYTPAALPVAWTQTAAWVDALQQNQTAQEAPLEELRERLEQLRQQPAGDWYSHSSLEAGDSLREQTGQSIAGLARDMQAALGALGTMEKFSETTSALEKTAVGETLANALKGLELGNLPLNQELLNQLKGIDPTKLKTLTPEQLAELKRRLAQGDKVCQACLHPGWDKDAKEIMLVQSVTPGGKGGGESSGPLTLQEKPTDLGTTTTAALPNTDMSQALPGDLMGVAQGEHKVDPSKFGGLAAGGAIASTGQGGEAVWRNDLTPSEREVLKRFFK